MSFSLTPARVAQEGGRPWRSVALVGAGLAAVVALGVLGKAPDRPAVSPPPTLPPVAVVPSAMPGNALAPIPAQASCRTPRTVALPGPIARHPRALHPTGLETLSAWSPAGGQLVADAVSGFWSMAGGHLARLDATGQAIGTWTVDDDALFGGYSIAAARDGGVWLFGGQQLGPAWFDGQAMRDSLPAVGYVTGLAEAYDRSVWVATDVGVFHWDGEAWTEVCRDAVGPGAGAIAIDRRGDVWVTDLGSDGYISVSRYNGKQWTTYDDDGLRDVAVLAAGDDGTVWAGGQDGVARFDGTTWADARGGSTVELTGTLSLSIAPDGSLWAAAGTRPAQAQSEDVDPGPLPGAGVAHLGSAGWTAYGPGDGLPTPGAAWMPTVNAIVASRDGVVAVTADGLSRLDGSRWVGFGPRAATCRVGQVIVAVSATEAWAADNELWHVANGRCTPVPLPSSGPDTWIIDLAIGRDGTLAVASYRGLDVRRGGRWFVLDDGFYAAADIGADGTVWALSVWDPAVEAWRQEGGAWTRIGWPLATSDVVVTPDGSVWATSPDSPLAPIQRYDGGHWVTVAIPQPATRQLVPGRFAVGPDGSLWATLSESGTWAPGRVWIAHQSGSSWTVRPVGDGWAGHIAIAPDGAAWTWTDAGLIRFSGGRAVVAVPDIAPGAVSIAPDGTIWIGGPSGVARVSPAIVAAAVAEAANIPGQPPTRPGRP